MLIDFHCHTKATKTGEDKKRNINPQDFREKIINAQVKIVAITNHNYFNLKEFNEFVSSAGDDFLVLPGIELDVKGLNDEVGHVVLVYDNLEVEKFNLEINKLLGENSPDEFIINLDSLIKFVNKNNYIVLAHYHKDNSLDETSIDKIKADIKEKYLFFYEPGSYRTLGIMINNKIRALKGSDVINWENYSEQDFANIKLDIDSYKSLINFIKKDETVIESLLNKQTKYKMDISYKGEKENIEIYDDINVFFGTKGTGKTVSLEKLVKNFSDMAKDVKFYSPDKTSEQIKEKLAIDEEERKLEYYNHDNRKESFDSIYKWKESEVTQFSEYYNYIKYAGKNKNKAKMKIITINQLLDYDNKVIQDIKTDYDRIQKVNKLIDEIDVSKYIESKEITILKKSMDNLSQSILNAYSSEFDKSTGVYLANHCIKQIKTAVEKNTETKTVPTGTGFKEYVKSLYKLENYTNKIMDGFNTKIEISNEYIGTLEENKKMYKTTRVSILNNHSKTEDGFSHINKIKEFKNAIIELNQNIYTSNLKNKFSVYREKYSEFSEPSLDDFVGIKKEFILNGESYIPSKGEETMLVLNEILDDSHDVYILDEPEKSLGNNYISEVLVPRINDLAKLKKIIIIATHNANIAVRTFPYCSILKTYFNGRYNTYVGNPYTNKLVNIHDQKDIKNWKDESITILEGGREAFYERGDIYE